MHNDFLPAVIALLCLGSAGAMAQTQGAAALDYACPLAGAARVSAAGALAAGAWTTAGGFDDQRSIGIDAQRNRIVVRHGGIDFDAIAGTAVYAVRSGRVALAATRSHLGNTVVLDHGDGEYSVYAFLGSLGILEGTTVQRGATLGTIGFSGDAATVQRQRADATARLHFALLSGKHPGLAGAGQPLRELADGPDAWGARFDSLATPVDPGKVLPAKCIDARPR
jgi:murein DD-endopeptidase MepM/ murein hydrolase activator NlpD